MFEIYMKSWNQVSSCAYPLVLGKVAFLQSARSTAHGEVNTWPSAGSAALGKTGARPTCQPLLLHALILSISSLSISISISLSLSRPLSANESVLADSAPCLLRIAASGLRLLSCRPTPPSSPEASSAAPPEAVVARGRPQSPEAVVAPGSSASRRPGQGETVHDLFGYEIDIQCAMINVARALDKIE